MSSELVIKLEEQHKIDIELIRQLSMSVETCIQNDSTIHEDVVFYKKAWCLKGTAIGFMGGVVACVSVYSILMSV